MPITSVQVLRNHPQLLSFSHPSPHTQYNMLANLVDFTFKIYPASLTSCDLHHYPRDPSHHPTHTWVIEIISYWPPCLSTCCCTVVFFQYKNQSNPWKYVRSCHTSFQNPPVTFQDSRSQRQFLQWPPWSPGPGSLLPPWSHPFSLAPLMNAVQPHRPPIAPQYARYVPTLGAFVILSPVPSELYPQVSTRWCSSFPQFKCHL